MLPTLDLERVRVARGRTLAVLAHAGGGIARDSMRTVWHDLASRLAGAAPRHLPIVRTAHGKPRFAGEAGLWFNTSYGTNWSLLALSRSGEVGCDVEDRLAPDDHVRLADAVLHPAESSAFAQLEPKARKEAFARCWVLKEAVLKAQGMGLAADPRGIDTTAIQGWRMHELPAAGVPLAVVSADAACDWFALHERS